MGKGILKVTVLECGKKVKDRTSKEYEIDFHVSNLEKAFPGELELEWLFPEGAQLKAEALANGKVEIL